MGKEAKYVVRLSQEERRELEKLLKAPRVARAKALRARMLLKADCDGPAWSDAQIAEAFDVSLSSVHRLRQRLVEEGLETALQRKPLCRTRPASLDGVQEARLIAIACSEAPEGRTRWTLQLLADKLVELKVVDTISDETVRKTLKKPTSSLGYMNNG
jgi:transposase